MRFAFFPESKRWRSNPYLDLLQAGLEELGIESESVGSDYMSGQWLTRHRKRVNVLHFHWIQYHYLQSFSRGSWRALAKFIGQILLARTLGYRVVWTMHNLLPHERVRGHVDVVARRAMALLAHSVLVLCEEGRRQLAEHFGRRKQVYVTPHGHYIGTYPDGMNREQSRMQLGLEPKEVMYLFFGGVRAHKNVEGLLRTFARMPGENMRLFIVGAAHSDEIRRRVTRLAAADPRVNAVLDFVPEDEVQCYMEAADVVVLPFSRILSSSSVITAMSFERPVIAPAMGCLPEWLTEDCSLLYDPVEPDGLRRAMLAARGADLTGMGRTAYERVRELSWDGIAKKTLAAYQGA